MNLRTFIKSLEKERSQYAAIGVKFFAVAGSDDWDSLAGECEAMATIKDESAPSPRSLEIHGVPVFRSASQKTGLMFGCNP